MAKIEDAGPPPRAALSRPLRIRDVPEGGLDRQLVATPQECQAIATEFGFPAIASLRAELRVRAGVGGRFKVTGTVESILTQVCVVTLDPFEGLLRQDVDITFASPPREGATPRVVDIDVDADETAPDWIVDNTIDLGAVAVEFLMLACDPYPKKPGVHFTDVLVGDTGRDDPSPFAALARLKDLS